MKEIRTNAEKLLRSDYNEYSDKTQTLREWVDYSSQSDDGFFNWFFDNHELESSDLSEEDKELFKDFLDSLQLSKSELIQFAKSEDFAFCFGAGLMTANDDETRQMVLDHLKKDGIIIEEVTFESCTDLKEEVFENNCAIYKAYKQNEEAMYIAYYK